MERALREAEVAAEEELHDSSGPEMNSAVSYRTAPVPPLGIGANIGTRRASIPSAPPSIFGRFPSSLALARATPPSLEGPLTLQASRSTSGKRHVIVSEIESEVGKLVSTTSTACQKKKGIF